ncbi:3'-phosphoadenylsulfate reductase [Ophidiomyces ophidiicola]|nr:3'-phosphoadenylsulfate reductase [Ophidiomyces ophidiicola]
MPAAIHSSYPSDTENNDMKDLESGYVSGGSSEASPPELIFTKAHLKFLNRQLQFLEPQDVLRWCITSLPGLFQTTAFGLTGLVTLDMLSKLDVPRPQVVDLIFLDTLHHFPETLALVDRIRKIYPNVNIHVYKPDGTDNVEEFNAKHGERLWETNDQLYDWVAKVEPAQRAYRELQVNAVLTGRRRSQGGKRGDMDIVEIDEAGLIKINPLANWNFQQVKEYATTHNVPYNELLDRGYKSVGDWHSTQPVKEGEDERAGRWKGQAKTECGIHNPRSKYAQFLRDQELKRQEEVLKQALMGNEVKEVELAPEQPAVIESKPEPMEIEVKPEPFDLEPKPEQFKVEIKPEQLPTEVKPEQLPVETKSEQLPNEVKSEQFEVEVQPEPFHLETHPEKFTVEGKPEQLPVEIKPEQLLTEVKPEQLTVEMKAEPLVV